MEGNVFRTNHLIYSAESKLEDYMMVAEHFYMQRFKLN